VNFIRTMSRRQRRWNR